MRTNIILTTAGVPGLTGALALANATPAASTTVTVPKSGPVAADDRLVGQLVAYSSFSTS